jgi:amino acid adenylation domain-containing protein
MCHKSDQDDSNWQQYLLTPTESALLTSWNDSTEIYPDDACVPQLVAAQAAARPDAVALTGEGGVVLYRELISRADRLAQHLRSIGSGPGTLVALYLERSPDLVIGALGVLKSGAAYLPLDPTYPPERLVFMLNDSQAAILLTRQHLARALPPGAWHVIDLDLDAERIASYPSEAPNTDSQLEQLAYVIYTSGSTGQPKGVQITHSSLLNLVFWHRSAFKVSADDRATLLASPGFDASVWELWPYLTAGGSLHIPGENVRSDAERLRDWLIAQRITIMFAPTAMAELVMALEWPTPVALRFLLTGADVLHRHPPRRLPFTLVNNYGPTECTVVATSGTVPSSESTEDRPTIGKPIANAQIYILDEHLRRVPVGAPGELFIGGKGVARGYLNQPELTDEKFIPDPFSSTPGTRLYRTGDLGRFMPDGQIAFMGRIDEQIKIRGYRIEPNEIITVLNRHSTISASHAIAETNPMGEKGLIAYVVPAPGSHPSCSELRDFLQLYLPEYMVPTVFVSLDSLPLTSNGKVNRHALPIPSASNSLQSEPRVAARTLFERRVAAIVAKLLRVQSVDASDNFFLLGGHSLLGTQLIASIQENFGVELSLRSLFTAPTVAELSAEIENLLLAKLEAMSEQDAQRLLATLA